MDVFKHLGHIALRVKDLDASLAFYGKLGFREMTRLLNDRGEPWIVYLRINDDQYLELFPKGVQGPAAAENATGIFHICLTVEDIDATVAHLEEVGIGLSRPRPKTIGIDGNRGMWIEDPDGTQIEVMEMAPNCIQFQAIERLKQHTVQG
jgi:lactoylglutathione lyase